MIRKFSVLLLANLFTVACATSDNDPNKKAKTGAAIGAAAGAVAGAIIGNQGGNNRSGAVIGAAVGAAIGGAAGHRMDQQQQELQQIPGVEVTRPAENQIDVRLTSDVLFDYNSSALRPESRATLSDLAGNFRRYSRSGAGPSSRCSPPATRSSTSKGIPIRPALPTTTRRCPKSALIRSRASSSIRAWPARASTRSATARRGRRRRTTRRKDGS